MPKFILSNQDEIYFRVKNSLGKIDKIPESFDWKDIDKQELNRLLFNPNEICNNYYMPLIVLLFTVKHSKTCVLNEFKALEECAKLLICDSNGNHENQCPLSHSNSECTCKLKDPLEREKLVSHRKSWIESISEILTIDVHLLTSEFHFQSENGQDENSESRKVSIEEIATVNDTIQPFVEILDPNLYQWFKSKILNP